jgi:HlyD family secretion protein
MKRVIIIVVVIAVIAGGFFLWQQFNARKTQNELLSGLQTVAAERGSLVSTIGATGVVRSNQSATLNWQTSGTVGQILVKEGEQVKAGQILAALEETSLPQNVILAQADLVNAEKALEDLLNSELQQAIALQAVEEAQQALDDINNPDLQQALALQAIADAQKAVDLAETALGNLQGTAGQADIDAAQAQVVIAREALDQAKERFAPYENKPEDNLTRANLQSQVAQAQQQYDFAVRNYNALLASASETDVALAEANLATAKAKLLDAERQYERIKNGPNPADVALLEAKLKDAQREWERIKDGPDPDDIAVAEARVNAAKATLNQKQIKAPFDGVVTMVENKYGDQVSPGSPAFRIDDLSHLLVDLEVSEIDINRLENGQTVNMTFDAILGKEYRGELIEVSLVGTQLEGIVNFSVTIELVDIDDQVKPGMTSAVNIVVGQLDDVLLVSNRAVRVVDNERVVYILLNNGQLEQVNITLGASSDVYSEVVEGDLEVGDLIVLNPPSSFFDQGIEMGPGQGGPFTRGGGMMP